MKILVISQYYSPEPFRHPDFCEELAKLGHDVTVVTGTPNYPYGKTYEEYKFGKRSDETVNGVKVHRCRTIARHNGIIFRFLNYYSFSFLSSRYIKKISSDFDIVFVVQLSPVMMANAAIKYKKLYGKKLVMYCLDLWPESLVAGGIKQNSLIYKHYFKVARRIYSQADKTLVSSFDFSNYLKNNFGISDIEYLPQYSEEIFSPEICKKEPDEYTDLMFAGNIGAAQDLGTVVSAAELTKDNPKIRWHIVGDGSELSNIKKLAVGLPNVIFYGEKALAEMPEFYAKADAMIVTLQNDEMLSQTLPGKVQTYLAAGKPIIAAINGETAKLINQSNCGLCCEAGDAKALAGFAEALKNTDTPFSSNAYNYYINNFSKKKFMETLEKTLGDCI